MNKKKFKRIFFIFIHIICYFSILINSMNKRKNNKKTNFKIKRLILLKEKKLHKIKSNFILYIKNYELRNKKRKNNLNDIFNQLSGNKNHENLNIEHYNLTPKLKKTVQFFQSMPNNPYYKSQQVILLGKKCSPMPCEFKTRQNQVLGCQSTVYIYPNVELNENKKSIVWLGDSDGLLTKGIVYILIDGLSGYSPEEILKVNPNFITLTGISEFLTMSRINGYLNIMNKIKMFSTNILKNIEK
ncbi:cysteine desulfuration protein SufE, putative [Plasmodium gallinaceum]|uniref:Cysteine desulfuration protein SufE, putative n=1 Tax=Plasmodium gallinaceum TaxID=5849 RepID=A0A1J1GWM3_PLAGA|nr:cysteine desulfuration protein SufE, putative [Plasmodium gallinaceum]CRG95413.1 cysteine desulfuration protein SufE, putative [Plasmodium gallinaceum]